MFIGKVPKVFQVSAFGLMTVINCHATIVRSVVLKKAATPQERESIVTLYGDFHIETDKRLLNIIGELDYIATHKPDIAKETHLILEDYSNKRTTQFIEERREFYAHVPNDDMAKFAALMFAKYKDKFKISFPCHGSGGFGLSRNEYHQSTFLTYLMTLLKPDLLKQREAKKERMWLSIKYAAGSYSFLNHDAALFDQSTKNFVNKEIDSINSSIKAFFDDMQPNVEQLTNITPIVDKFMKQSKIIKNDVKYYLVQKTIEGFLGESIQNKLKIANALIEICKRRHMGIFDLNALTAILDPSHKYKFVYSGAAHTEQLVDWLTSRFGYEIVDDSMDTSTFQKSYKLLIDSIYDEKAPSLSIERTFCKYYISQNLIKKNLLSKATGIKVPRKHIVATTEKSIDQLLRERGLKLVSSNSKAFLYNFTIPGGAISNLILLYIASLITINIYASISSSFS